MKSTFALLSLFGTVALAGGVTDEIAPDDSYPQGCSKAFSGNFQVTVATIKEAAKRDVHQVGLLHTFTSIQPKILTV